MNLISDMHPILVLFSHHAEKNGLRNGEVINLKLAGPKSECTEERTHLRKIHFLEVLGNDIQKGTRDSGTVCSLLGN